jgi:hypothetical protein
MLATKGTGVAADVDRFGPGPVDAEWASTRLPKTVELTMTTASPTTALAALRVACAVLH